MNAVVLLGLAVLVLGAFAVLDVLALREEARRQRELDDEAAEQAPVLDAATARRALTRANLVAAADHYADDGFLTEPLTMRAEPGEDTDVEELDLGDRYAPPLRRAGLLCMAVRDGYLCVRPHAAGRHVATCRGVVVRVWTDPADAVTETLAVRR